MGSDQACEMLLHRDTPARVTAQLRCHRRDTGTQRRPQSTPRRASLVYKGQENTAEGKGLEQQRGERFWWEETMSKDLGMRTSQAQGQRRCPSQEEAERQEETGYDNGSAVGETGPQKRPESGRCWTPTPGCPTGTCPRSP